MVLTVVMTLAGTAERYAFENEMNNGRMEHYDPRSLSYIQEFLSCSVKAKGNFCYTGLQGYEKTLGDLPSLCRLHRTHGSCALYPPVTHT